MGLSIPGVLNSFLFFADNSGSFSTFSISTSVLLGYFSYFTRPHDSWPRACVVIVRGDTSTSWGFPAWHRPSQLYRAHSFPFHRYFCVKRLSRCIDLRPQSVLSLYRRWHRIGRGPSSVTLTPYRGPTSFPQGNDMQRVSVVCPAMKQAGTFSQRLLLLGAEGTVKASTPSNLLPSVLITKLSRICLS